jgi:hypothetical protein
LEEAVEVAAVRVLAASAAAVSAAAEQVETGRLDRYWSD